MAGQALSRPFHPRGVVTREELRARLQTYSREPFLEVLSTVMQCSPTETELKKWAAKAPDRWAHAIEIFAKLGGFTEKREVTHSFVMQMMNMGDAEIQQTLAELENEEKGISVPYQNVSADKQIGYQSPDRESTKRVSADWALIWERPRGVPRTQKRGR
jgi:hypothetical protein